jgi:hypothetical protein
MQYGKYEIKKVTVNDRMSQGSICFSLDLYIDGKKFASVENVGRGGSHRTHTYPPFTAQDLALVEEEIAQDEFLVDDARFEHFDMAINTMILLHDAAKEVKRLTKSKAAFVDGDGIYSSGYSNGRLPDENLFERIRAEYPGAVILNTMSVEASAVESVKAARRKDAAELVANPLPRVPRL